MLILGRDEEASSSLGEAPGIRLGCEGRGLTGCGREVEGQAEGTQALRSPTVHTWPLRLATDRTHLSLTLLFGNTKSSATPHP